MLSIETEICNEEHIRVIFYSRLELISIEERWAKILQQARS